MKTDKRQSIEATELRRRAETLLKAKASKADLPLSEDEVLRLLHELQVHQIELEMQNSELHRARDDAELALEKYAELYDFAPVGYFTLDREGIVGAANITGATLLGVERSRLIGRRLGLFVAAEAFPAFTAFLARIFGQQTKETCEVPLLKAGENSFFVQIEGVVAASGEKCHIAVIDISLRRQLEEKLEKLLSDLAVRAAELEAANIELEAFNYSASHDLRVPLTIIAGYCDVVEEVYGSKLDDVCLGYIQTIHEGAMQMAMLIETLLKFSCIKRVEIHRDQVDLSSMATEVSLSLKATEPCRRVTFRIANGIIADGDASLLRVALDNLMGNAWKYSGHREETSIEFDATDIDGKRTYFVRDNGSGFDMEHAEKLFIPFQRLPGTDAAGHGIGLATVDRIIQRHGGRVWAESKPGEGATFFFTLGGTGKRRSVENGDYGHG